MKTISGYPVKSWTFVVIQFACFLILFITGPLIAKNPFYLSIEIISIGLGIWAVFLMDPLTINVLPDVRKEASLLKQGPYKLIRHPMYLAVLMLFLSLVLEKFSLFRLFIYVILLADLLLKIEYEEKLLISKYSAYNDYKSVTKKLIPYIY
jgi:protein-S-isoprenylcysteine O-methyltransferase Ste14